MNACEDFFSLVVVAHIIVAAMEIFCMSETTDDPPGDIFPESVEASDRETVLQSAVSVIVEEFINLSYPARKPKKCDHVQEYAKEILTMGLFYMNFQDAIREGDGHRVLRSWKFLLLFFRATGHSNYANEALLLLCQYKYLLPARFAEQLLCGRFINVHQGHPGSNIPADLHLEHLNRLIKDSLANLGANKTPKAIQRIGKAVGPLQEFLHHFDGITDIQSGSGSHTVRSDDRDLNRLIEELIKQNVFDFKPNRAHQHFPRFTSNVYKSINEKKLTKWMKSKFKKLLYSSHMNNYACLTVI